MPQSDHQLAVQLRAWAVGEMLECAGSSRASLLEAEVLEGESF